MKLHSVNIGNPESKKLIVFLHEGLGSVAQWKNFPEELCLATNSYGLVYDRSGYGLSEGDLTQRKADYLHNAAKELATVITDALSQAYDIYIYGHSDGGSIALIYAANHQNKVKGLIVEAAHVFVEEETLQGVTKARDLFNTGIFSGLQKYHGERWQEVFFAWNDIWLAPEFRQWNITSLLPYVLCPQLIIQGNDDQFATIDHVYSIAKNTKGEATMLLPKSCGHAPHKEAKQEVIHQATLFINAN